MHVGYASLHAVVFALLSDIGAHFYHAHLNLNLLGKGLVCVCM